MSESGRSDERLSAAHAHLAAWIVLAIVQVGVVSVAAPRPARTAVVLLRAAFECGASIATGIVFAALVTLGSRLPVQMRRRATWLLATLIGAAAVGALAEDLTGAVAWLPGPPRLYASIAAAACGIALVWATPLAVELATRPGPRGALALGSIVLFAGHGFVLQSGYHGIHLWAALMAGALLAGVLSHARPPRTRLARTRLLPLLLAPAALAGVLFAPTPSVLAAALRWPGSVIAPFVARARGGVCETPGEPNAEERAWFAGFERERLPSAPPLVAGDRIVLVFTIDALRADVLEGDAHARVLPHLTSLRGRSVRFSQARAASPATAPSVASILKGKYYSELSWSPQRIGSKLKYTLHQDESSGIATLLGAAGVRTLSLATPLGPKRLTGETRDFSEEILVERSAEQFPAELARRLNELEHGRWLVYGHFIEPHHPYDAPGATEFERYLGEVGRVDAAIGAIVEALRRAGLESRTVLLVTADHGEAFGEHGTRWHAVSMYDELLRVPLLVSAPGLAPRAVDVPVSTTDVGATLLDLFELPTPKGFPGDSLVPLLRGGSRPPRPIAADSGRRVQAMIFPDGTKLIEDTRHRVLSFFDLRRDPHELEDLADTHRDVACHKRGVLRRFFDARTKSAGHEPPYRP